MSSKSWKANIDGHKTSNSLIFGEYQKSPSPNHTNNAFTNKNSR